MTRLMFNLSDSHSMVVSLSPTHGNVLDFFITVKRDVKPNVDFAHEKCIRNIQNMCQKCPKY